MYSVFFLWKHKLSIFLHHSANKKYVTTFVMMVALRLLKTMQLSYFVFRNGQGLLNKQLFTIAVYSSWHIVLNLQKNDRKAYMLAKMCLTLNFILFAGKEDEMMIMAFIITVLILVALCIGSGILSYKL